MTERWDGLRHLADVRLAKRCTLAMRRDGFAVIRIHERNWCRDREWQDGAGLAALVRYFYGSKVHSARVAPNIHQSIATIPPFVRRAIVDKASGPLLVMWSADRAKVEQVGAMRRRLAVLEEAL